jgi:uncharacterized membrane protein
MPWNLHHAISPAAWWKRLLQPLISRGKKTKVAFLLFNSDEKEKEKEKTKKGP